MRRPGSGRTANQAQPSPATTPTGPATRGPARTAGLAWAAGSGHDYTHCGPPPLPAWFYVLQGQPVPDDAPRTRPPTGFAELMAKRRGGNPDSGSGQAVPAERPGTGQAAPADATAPAPAGQGSSGIGSPPVGA